VNALDAAFVAYAGISALRQQIRPEQRVHGVISGRDWTPNGSFPFTFFFSYRRHRRHHRVLSPHLTSPRASKERDKRDNNNKKKKEGQNGEGGGGRSTSDADFFFLFFFFGICDSHPRLRQDVMVCPRGGMGRARASARARGELPRVRTRSFLSAKNQHKQLN
jgi:hypothetical protein